MREKHQWLPSVHIQPEIKHTIYVCALTGDEAHNLSVHGTILQQLSQPAGAVDWILMIVDQLSQNL